MHISTFAAAATLCAAGLAARNGPCELAVNGDLELGSLSGWQEFPSSAGSISLVSPGNVSGSTAVGGLLLGAQQISTPTPFGGTLLVNSLVTETFPMLPAAGGTYPLPIPTDSALCGVTLYGQAIHSDPGASAGVAFTPGIAINIGG